MESNDHPDLVHLAPRFASRERLRKAYHTTKLIALKPVHHFTIPAQPWLDPEALDCFTELTAAARNYLEYGSGGSTVFASQHVSHLVSVDSDRYFLRDVQRRLLELNPPAETKLIHANIGMTELWGRPVFTRHTPRRLRHWQAYPKAPWDQYRAIGIEPDLILVDGRFRVACVLESLRSLRKDGVTILVDDYLTRPHYKAVEEFADLCAMQGRMAVLRRKANIDHDRLLAALRLAYLDHR